MTIGIYILFFENEDRVYIGQSGNIENRLRQHINMLKGVYHHSKKLQLFYNETQLLPTLEVLEETLVRDMNEREVFWIAEFDSFEKGFNGNPGGGAFGHGEDHPGALILNKEAKYAILEMGNTSKCPGAVAKELNVPQHIISNISRGSTHGFLESECPLEYAMMLDKIGTRQKNYTEDVYVRILLEISRTSKRLTEIATELDVSIDVVKDISIGKTHKYLANEYPEDYKIMLSKIGTRPTGPIRDTLHPSVLSPTGIQYSFYSTRAFAKEHGLDQGHLGKVLNGKAKSHKGWKLA